MTTNSLPLTASVTGESITESEEYQLERRATAFKQAGDWDNAIDCLRKAQAIRGLLGAETRLAKFLQQAGQFDEAMQEINQLIADSNAWAEGHFGHQPRPVRRRQQASRLARTHDEAVLICKRERRHDLRSHHEAEAERWWAITRQLESAAKRDKEAP